MLLSILLHLVLLSSSLLLLLLLLMLLLFFTAMNDTQECRHERNSRGSARVCSGNYALGVHQHQRTRKSTSEFRLKAGTLIAPSTCTSINLADGLSPAFWARLPNNPPPGSRLITSGASYNFIFCPGASSRHHVCVCVCTQKNKNLSDRTTSRKSCCSPP